jgi:hypothetical protein
MSLQDFKMLFPVPFVAIVLFSSISTVISYSATPSILPPSNSYILHAAVQSHGILTLQFDPSKNVSSSISVLDTNIQGGYRPGWLHLRENMLYSISREQYPTVNDSSGGIFSFSVNSTHRNSQPTGSRLDFLSSVSSSGKGGVTVFTSPDGCTLAAANM